jgi:hypothetical protein
MDSALSTKPMDLSSRKDGGKTANSLARRHLPVALRAMRLLLILLHPLSFLPPLHMSLPVVPSSLLLRYPRLLLPLPQSVWAKSNVPVVVL